ncbi:type 1 fimbrial protein [Pantoea sp. Bo_2]|uniref:Type 1 fimbrial protein n=2 Tax=Pantoea TaxID=53335 RepID=A0AB34CJH5_9GAMM|nr:MULTISPECIES: fimbrial protein [Pantoea]KAA5931005.1 type 1 fimbrial protein [Pantoea sp. VH_8]KAA5935672.1 type 1 fimbrial protein [Pantoea sp. VH_4]KAA5948789.1 type 1 fimbrial protein [Pantoea sp. VH_3]KAA5955172.1 type 1 fimbrial protein [Pantoea sp. VH_25]KAA5957638.1 type 1 fimbrial protein [Pantoea sp. VH_24]
MNRQRMFAVLLVISLFSYCKLIYAEANDETTVYVSGDILDTPCTIAPDSRMQVISMGRIRPAEIEHTGAGEAIPFTIRLIDCRLQRIDPHQPNWQRFAVSFDGQTDGDDFALAGTAQGMALQLADENGNIAHPGVPLPQAVLHNGEQVLHYTLRLVSNHQPLREGSYSSAIHFRLNYF